MSAPAPFDFSGVSRGRLAKAREFAGQGMFGRAKQQIERGGGEWSKAMSRALRGETGMSPIELKKAKNAAVNQAKLARQKQHAANVLASRKKHAANVRAAKQKHAKQLRQAEHRRNVAAREERKAEIAQQRSQVRRDAGANTGGQGDRSFLDRISDPLFYLKNTTDPAANQFITGTPIIDFYKNYLSLEEQKVAADRRNETLSPFAALLKEGYDHGGPWLPSRFMPSFERAIKGEYTVPSLLYKLMKHGIQDLKNKKEEQDKQKWDFIDNIRTGVKEDYRDDPSRNDYIAASGSGDSFLDNFISPAEADAKWGLSLRPYGSGYDGAVITIGNQVPFTPPTGTVTAPPRAVVNTSDPTLSDWYADVVAEQVFGGEGDVGGEYGGMDAGYSGGPL